MKSRYYKLSLLLLTSLLFSCEKSNIEFDDAFEKSYKTWLNFKELSDNSYKYKVSRASWVGITWETTITVTKGTITQRHFKLVYTEKSEDNIPTKTEEWTENENEINTHTDSGAAEPITLDVIYENAQNDWLVKKRNREIYFETKNNGLISLCGYVEDQCADDCFVGINIAFIEPLK
ncbi:MAG: hypothetical protein PHI32_01615 [Dysgonamonadaceae bacterium]|nr:hypothetical protein [Dysgonamonadaceae bacterium]MDD4727910.1 hypothetical protein [Dysgonamonadaceae bacterium]